ncbi:hypothetical protein AcV5_010349 [Taiwanofungus camphoratus]|nr:hypothetical protein AcV5_010349 [Antrodia cinnamomea]
MMFKKSSYAHLPSPKPNTWMGYLPDMHDMDSLEYHYTMCDKYGHAVRLQGGLGGLQKDALYITDPLALNSILVRDQYNFPESTEFAGLFGIVHHGSPLPCVTGSEHKRQRKILNPIFTASHVAKLMPLFYNVAYQLRDRIASELEHKPAAYRLDILDHLTRTALELVAQGGLGHTFNSFEKKNEFQDFYEALRMILPWASRLFIVLPYLQTWRHLEPVWLRNGLSRAIGYIPWPSARKFKKCVDVMHPVFRDLYKAKKAMFDQYGVEELRKTATGGNDLASVLMQVNAEADEEDKLSDELVIATYSAIIHGGQETTSGVLSRLLSLMAKDTDLQERLRTEIRDAQTKKGSGEELAYSELNSLPLLDAVCREFLRLFPPVTFVWRETKEDCVVPLQFPIRDPVTGAQTSELLITQGTSVYIGLAAPNMSRAIWGDDVHEFKPERWFNKMGTETTENSIKMPGIYGNMMTFLGGGRACPGMKFALLEMKLVLSVILPAFSFEEAEEIVWRLGITVVPLIKGKEDKGLSVPMKVKSLLSH